VDIVEILKLIGNTVGQLVVGLSAYFLGLSTPMWASEPEDATPSMGVFGVLAGLVVGVAAPLYLGAEGWWAIVLMMLGGALFFALGVSCLAAILWGPAGAALGAVGFAATMHFSLVLHAGQIGPNPIVVKIGALLILCLAAFLLGESVRGSSGHSPVGCASGQTIVFWLGAALTVLEFFNIIFGLWEKLIG
jgi:hypothetical protein